MKWRKRWPKLAHHLLSFIDAADPNTPTWARDLIASGWSQNEVLDELIESIAAGHDAPANLLAAVLYELARNPGIQEQLYDELRKAGLEAGQPTLTLSVLRDIPLLKSIIDETHRLHPAVELLPRFASHECRIGSVDVPHGTVIWGNYFAAQTDGRWQDPLQWNPFRFMDSARPAPKLLRPFGAGPRGCPGMGFSEAEVMVMCSQMVLAARFSACPETKWETRHYATTGPKQGLILTVAPRQ